MRGARPRQRTLSLVASLVTILLIGSMNVSAALPGLASLPDAGPPALPADALAALGSDEERSEWQNELAWIERIPVDRLPDAARAYAKEYGATGIPAPDLVPGYAMLSEPEQRTVWSMWILTSAFASSRTFAGSAGLDDVAASAGAYASQAEGAAVVPGEIGEPRGLRPLWSLDSHGVPYEVLSAGAGGATFLVTSDGVLKFPAPGARPDWMIKPSGWVTHVETVDANADDALDLVIGTYSFASEDDASILIVDGATGETLFRGFGGEEALGIWTLTDADGDGGDEILGVTGAADIVVAELDGDVISTRPIDRLPQTGGFGFLLFYVGSYYSMYQGSAFADADGDGVKDVLVASGYLAFAGGPCFVVVCAFAYGTLPLLTVYSGVDGAVLWRATSGPSPGISYAFPIGAGDFDGDGSEDVLLYHFSFVPAALLRAFYSGGQSVVSGADGATLARDRTECVAVVCLPSEVYEPFGLVDLDHDGVAEIVGFQVEQAMRGDEWVVKSIDIMGRGPSATGIGASEELWRVTWDLPSENLFDAWIRVRDTNVDGEPELSVGLVTYDKDDEDNITAIHTHLYAIDAKGATGGQSAALLGTHDVDEATGQVYGWMLPEDRWVPLDAAGGPAARGMRMVISAYPAEIRDNDGDTVPDFLLWKALGLMWVDGASGALKADVERPLTHYPVAIFEEKGRLRILEYGFLNNDAVLSDLKTGAELWRIPGKEMDDDNRWSYIQDLVDVTGDGLLDVVIGYYEFRGHKDGIYVLDMAKDGQQIWSRILYDGDSSEGSWVVFEDIDPTHRGAEIIVQTEDWEAATVSLALHVVEEDAARWSVDLGGDAGLVEAKAGFVVLQEHEEGAVLRFLDAKTGEEVAEHALPAESWVSSLRLDDVDKDGTAEAVVSYIVEDDDGDDATQHTLVYDLSKRAVLSAYRIADPAVQHFYFDGWSFEFYEPSYLTEEVGDWDSDGLVDYAYREEAVPTIRSSGSGDILAVGPARGAILWAPDLNDDGRNEVAMISDVGTLRLFASAKTSVTLEREGPVRLVGAPDSAHTENERFFEETGLLPAPGVALAALALVGIAFVARRRRL